MTVTPGPCQKLGYTRGCKLNTRWQHSGVGRENTKLVWFHQEKSGRQALRKNYGNGCTKRRLFENTRKYTKKCDMTADMIENRQGVGNNGEECPTKDADMLYKGEQVKNRLYDSHSTFITAVVLFIGGKARGKCNLSVVCWVIFSDILLRIGIIRKIYILYWNGQNLFVHQLLEFICDSGCRDVHTRRT